MVRDRQLNTNRQGSGFDRQSPAPRRKEWHGPVRSMWLKVNTFIPSTQSLTRRRSFANLSSADSNTARAPQVKPQLRDARGEHPDLTDLISFANAHRSRLPLQTAPQTGSRPLSSLSDQGESTRHESLTKRSHSVRFSKIPDQSTENTRTVVDSTDALAPALPSFRPLSPITLTSKAESGRPTIKAKAIDIGHGYGDGTGQGATHTAATAAGSLAEPPRRMLLVDLSASLNRERRCGLGDASKFPLPYTGVRANGPMRRSVLVPEDKPAYSHMWAGLQKCRFCSHKR